jgi:hypothetical protein
MDCEVRFREHDRAREPGALELVEGRVHGRKTGRGHHLEALGAEALAVQKELRVAAAAGEVTDEMQTVHSHTLQNAKAQPAAYLGSRPRLPFAPSGAKQRSSIALNSCKTS